MSAINWTEEARDQLADVYVSTPAEERDAFVRSVQEIERELASNGLFAGESRSGRVRVYIFGPLSVTYTVIPHGPVRIDRVRSSRPRRRGG